MTIPFLFRTSLVISTLGLLAGCAGLNSQFDCPMPPGVMCKSLDEVNKMVDQGKLGGSDALALDSQLTRSRSKVVRIGIPSENRQENYYLSSDRGDNDS
jgi:hypothetical protein